MSIRRLCFVFFASLLLAGAPALMAQGGHWEFGGHYGRWTLDILGSKANELLNDALDTELRDRILETIQEDHPSLSLTNYQQTINFDSSGDDFGASIRWYPGGRRGSFSLGVSVEKSKFKIVPAAAVLMQLQDQVSSQTATFDGTADATAILKAMSFLLTMRWDIFPSKAVHPYITFGGGISTSKALDDSSVAYSYSGQLTGNAVSPQTVSGSEAKTLRQLRDDAMNDDENDFPIPNFLPFIQLNLGLKVRLTKMVQVLVDIGVFDGFMASAGLAIRL
ncbi:MAG: hypothetical protein ACXWHI_04450 [Candidatus Aminicenantales bacterium]